MLLSRGVLPQRQVKLARKAKTGCKSQPALKRSYAIGIGAPEEMKGAPIPFGVKCLDVKDYGKRAAFLKQGRVLARDYIAACLYGRTESYFTSYAPVHSLDEPLNFNSLKDMEEYRVCHDMLT